MVPRGLCRWVCQGLPRDPCLVLGLAGGVFISLLLSPSFLLGNQLGAHPSAKRFNNLCKRQGLLGAHWDHRAAPSQGFSSVFLGREKDSPELLQPSERVYFASGLIYMGLLI